MATLYLILKLLLVFWTAKVLRLKWAFDQFSSLIAGWLFVLASQAGLILGLSSVGLLQQSYFLAATAVLAFLFFWQTRSLHFGAVFFPRLWRDGLPLAAIVLVFSAMWLRSLFFYDYTWDAQTYGLPRLAIWLNSGSVLTHMPTLQLNLFVNEWNAELNSLAYGLASRSYLGFGFGNLEVLLALFAALTWVALQLGAPLFWALCLSAVLGSTPAMLGLASTVKGDLLACTAFVVACGWLIRIKRQNHSALALGMLLISASLAVGSKISVLLPILAIMILAVTVKGTSSIRDLLRLPGLTKLGIILAVLIFSSRYWSNWIVYGNPLKRVDGESAEFSFGNMLGNFSLTRDRMFGVWDEVLGNGRMWALAGSMGATVWFVAFIGVFLLMGVLARRVGLFTRTMPNEGKVEKNETTIEKYQSTIPLPKEIKWLALVGVAILSTTAISMALQRALPWSFRYFAPGIIVTLLGVGILVIGSNIFYIRKILIIAAVLVVAVNLKIVFRPGEILPIPDFSVLAMQVREANNPLKRISLLNRGPYQMAAVDMLNFDTANSLSILVFQSPDTSLIPFLGGRAQNRLRTVADVKDLIATSVTPKWDAVVIIQKAELRDNNLATTLARQGYWIGVDNEQYLIAIPLSRIQLTPLPIFKEVQWTPWNPSAGAQISVQDGSPSVESPYPIDAGFVSQEFRFNGVLVIKARFEGEIAGLGAHAGHLSLHGKLPIFTLPAGSYSPLTQFQGIVPESDGSAQRLAFGLGGWAEGSGHLKLVGIEAFQLRILENKPALKPTP